MNELLTVDEVATILRVSKRTAYDLVKSEIPVIRWGGAENSPIRVRRDDLDAWIERQRRGGD